MIVCCITCPLNKKIVPVSLEAVLRDMNDSSVPIDKLAYNVFGTMLQHEKCPELIVSNLKSQEYCRAYLKTNHPVLVRIRKYENRRGYYNDFLRCRNEYYYLYSEWKDHQRKVLISWLQYLVLVLKKYEDESLNKSHDTSANCTMLRRRFHVKQDESTRCLIHLNKGELRAAAKNGISCVFVLKKGNIKYECCIDAQELERMLLCHACNVTDKGKNWAFRLSFSNGSIATAFGLPAKEIGQTIATRAQTIDNLTKETFTKKKR